MLFCYFFAVRFYLYNNQNVIAANFFEDLLDVSWQFTNFEVGDFAFVNLEPHRRALLMESRKTCRPGVHGEASVFLVIHDAQDVGVSTYEYFGRVCIEDSPCRRRVVSRVAADVCHIDVRAFYFKALFERIDEPCLLVVHVAIDGFQGFEGCDSVRQF